MKNVVLIAAAVVGLAAGTVNAQDVIQNFDSLTAGAVAVFREAGFSGSTTANVDGTTDTAGVDATQAVSGLNSYRLFWTWSGAAPADAKVRITTNGATNSPNPLIDLSKKLTFQVKITQGSLANVAFLIRETGQSSGTIGSNGGTTPAVIETVTPAPTVALDSAVNSGWQKITLDLPTAANRTVVSFVGGDGALPTTGFATIEALYVTRGATGANVELFIDDLQQEGSASLAESWTIYN